MTEISHYVIDASVATKWYLSDEQHIEAARRVRLDFERGTIRLLAPSQLQHEVASAVLRATRNPERPRLMSGAEGLRILQDFLEWAIELIDHAALIPAAYNLARRFACSYYDALYLATSEMTNSPFVYADGKLRRALADRFPLALWIEEYQPASPLAPLCQVAYLRVQARPVVIIFRACLALGQCPDCRQAFSSDARRIKLNLSQMRQGMQSSQACIGDVRKQKVQVAQIAQPGHKYHGRIADLVAQVAQAKRR